MRGISESGTVISKNSVLFSLICVISLLEVMQENDCTGEFGVVALDAALGIPNTPRIKYIFLPFPNLLEPTSRIYRCQQHDYLTSI